MQIIINKERLVKEVQNVSKAISSRPALPILTGIKIIATEQGLTLTGSNLDIAINVDIPREEEGSEIVEVKETGGIVVNAKTFSEFIKKVPASDIELSTEDFKLVVGWKTKNVAGKGKGGEKGNSLKLVGLNLEEFPALPEYKEEKVVTINTKVLKRLIHNTSFAVSSSDTRPILTGVNWRLSNNTLIGTATDSHRLGKQTAEVVSNIDEAINVTIPGKHLAEVNKILDESVTETQIIFDENQIMFKSNNVTVYSRLLEGNYPETDKLIPSEGKTEVLICSKELGQAIDRATILDTSNRLVKIEIANNQAELSANSAEIGTLKEALILDSIKGDDLTIGCNAKYLADAVKRLDGKKAKICFTSSMRPFTLAPEDDDSTVHLILPVRMS